jgi:uncharacterized protein (TIGR03083 family)
MTYEEFLAAVTTEVEALAAVADAVGPAAAVPATPEWTMAKLVKHTGTTHRWAQAATGSTDFPNPGDLDLGLPADEAGYPDWLRAGAAAFVAALTELDPDTTCWAWGPDPRVHFWARRMAHESAIHRWDAQSASGDQEPVGTALAVDGVDERLENLPASTQFDAAAAAALVGTGESIHLHATDTDGEWLVRFTPDGLAWSKEHAKGDLAVRGPAADLLLVLVGRRGLDGLETFGDQDVLDRHQAITRF